MKKMAVIVGLVLGGALDSASALVLNESKILDLRIGQKGMTRLSVKDEKIIHIFSSPPTVGEHITHHDSGHVFLDNSGLPASIHITIVTETGKTQDLVLRPAPGITSKPIILEKPQIKRELEPESLQQRAAQVIKIFQAGGIAPGFKEMTPCVQSTRHMLNMDFKVIRSFKATSGQGKSLSVHIFEGKNKTFSSLPLNSAAFTRGRDLAIAASTAKVKSRGTAYFYVVQK